MASENNSKHDESFMCLAIAKASQGIKKGQTPFAACIVKEDKVISCQHNVVWKTGDITAHAEVHAIRQACKKLNAIDLSGCTLYSTCEPCPMCFSAIHWAKISRIVYGANIKDAQRAGFNELLISSKKMKKDGKSLVVIKGGLLEGECRELFRIWSKQKDKRVY